MLSKDEAETNGMVNDNDDNELANITAQINNMTLIEDEENEENSDDQIFSSKNPIFNFDRKSSKVIFFQIIAKIKLNLIYCHFFFF